MNIAIGNNNLIELTLRSSETGLVDTTATVTVTLRDYKTQVPVIGQAWPTPMTHVANGTYRGTLEHDLELDNNQVYIAHIDAVTTTDVRGHWETQLPAVVRR